MQIGIIWELKILPKWYQRDGAVAEFWSIEK